MENKLLGYNIRREREKLGLSQTELGKLVDATKQTVSNWEMVIELLRIKLSIN